MNARALLPQETRTREVQEEAERAEGAEGAPLATKTLVEDPPPPAPRRGTHPQRTLQWRAPDQRTRRETK